MNAPDLKLLHEHLPLITLTDRPGFIAGAITGRTNGFYNHVMWAHDVFLGQVRVASQDGLLRDKALDEYLKKCRIKFIRNKNWTTAERRALLVYIKQQLDLPVWKRLYDIRGVWGQLFGLRWMNIPGLRYCSEFVGDGLKQVEPSFQFKHPTPADINRWCKDRPEMVTVAKWDPDEQGLIKY